MELSELIAKLTEHDAQDVADALQENAQSHYQTVYQRGFSTAHNEAKASAKETEKKLEALQGQLAERDEKIEALQSEQPDVQAIEEKYQTRLAEKDEELTAAQEAARREVESIHRSRFESELAAELIAQGVEPDYAREVLVSKHRSRIQPTKTDDGYQLKVMGEDGMTPVQAADGKLAHVVASSIKESVGPKWITSNGDKGAGSQAGGKGSGGYDPVAAGKKMAEAANSGGSELAFK